jgi:dihydroorotate dehydrogenase electron transfer subunit
MNYKPFKITEIRRETDSLRTFLFDKSIEALPGQFVFAWIPGISEKPFSLSYSNPLGITVRKLKHFTSALFDLKEGDSVWIRGPYGNGFPIDKLNSSKVVYIIGGGTGIAPLALLAEKLRNVEVISFLGAKTADEVILKERFEKVSKTYITTEDGSEGDKGLVTDTLRKHAIMKNSMAAICGPERMLSSTAQILTEHIEPSNIYLSLERYMKCGRGACGSCEFGGYRICVDGPVFSYGKVKTIGDFGNFKKDRAGRKEYKI